MLFFSFLLAINTAYMAFVEATYTSEGRRIDAVCSEIMLKLLLDLGLWLEGFCTKSPQTGQVLEAMVEVWAFQVLLAKSTSCNFTVPQTYRNTCSESFQN